MISRPIWGAGLGYGRRFRFANQPQGHRRKHERDGVEQDRDRRRKSLDQGAGKPWSDYARDRLGERHLTIALDDVFDIHQRRKVSLIAHVEEDAEDRGDGGYEIEEAHIQMAERCRQRDESEHRGSPQVTGDQNRPAPQTVGPSSGEQPEEQDRGAVDAVEISHLQRRRFEQQDGGHGQPDQGDPRSHLGYGLARPQLQKIRLVPEALARHLRVFRT